MPDATLDLERRARAALAAAGGDPAADLRLVRLKPEKTASFRAGAAFVKLYLGPEAADRAATAHAAQTRAAGITGRAGPLSPAPGPLTGYGFAMDWVEGRRFGDAMRGRLAPARRAGLMRAAGDTLRRLHDVDAAPVPFGAWPAGLLRKAAAGADPLWPGFAAQVAFTVKRLEAEAAAPCPAGLVHGDLHAENLILRPDSGLTLVDFNRFARRPAIGDIALLFATTIARAPRPVLARRGRFGLGRTEEAAFFDGYGPCWGGAEALALHTLRFCLTRALITADARRGPRTPTHRRRLRRLGVAATEIYRGLAG